jgi:RNA polymerase sigma factor (sigma-70 family)
MKESRPMPSLASTEQPEPHADDETVVLLIMERDEEGLRRLIAAHGPKVFGWLAKKYRGILARDDCMSILHEAAAKVWTKIEKFDDSRSSLGSWFLAIAQNTAIDFLRGPGGQPLEVVEDPSGFIDPNSEEDEPDSEAASAARALDDIIEHKLSPQQQRIIRADLASGDTADGVWLAGQLGTSTASIHTARNKAHKTIREEFTKRGLAPSKGESHERSR